jgi:hypothetical protein
MGETHATSSVVVAESWPVAASAYRTLSWAVFVDGVVVPSLTGLNRSQARYFRHQIIEEKRLSDDRSGHICTSDMNNEG